MSVQIWSVNSVPLLQRKTAAELYARQQAAAVESQEREIASLTDQLARVDEITSQTVPMLEALDR